MGFSINLGSLMVSVGLDTKGVDDGKKKVNEGFDEMSKKASESGAAFGKWAVAATAAAAAAAVAIIKSSLDATAELNKLATVTGLTVAEFQKGAFAAKQYGIEQEKFADIIKNANEKMGAFLMTGTGPMKDFFDKIGPKVGVTAEQFKKLSGPEAMQLYVSSLEKAGVNQKEMTFYMENLANDSTALLPLLRDNGKAMGEMAQRAEELGIGLSQIDAQRAVEAQRGLAQIGSTISNEVQKSVAQLAPFITAISEKFAEFIAESGGISQYVVPAFEIAARVVGVFADGIHGIKIIFKGLEIIARGVIGGIAIGFDLLVKGAAALGNAIIDGIVYPFRKALEIAAKFSDSAKEALTAFDGVVDKLKFDGIQGVEDFANASVEAVETAKGEMFDMLMQPLPSQRIKEFIEGVKQTAAEAAPEIAASLSGAGVGTGAGAGASPEEKTKASEEARGPTEADRIREQMQYMYDAMIEEGLMREETLVARYERERQLLEEGLNNKYLTEEQYSMLSRQLAQDEAAFKTDVMLSTMDALVEAVSVGGKKANKLQQGLAIANAVIHGKEAAVAAWSAGMSVGGPWAPLVAAAYTAASIARTASMISSIKSGGSSMSGMGGKGAGVSPGDAKGAGESNGGGGGGQQGAKNIEIRLTGAGLFSTDQVRELIGQINQQVGDGVKLNASTAGA